MQVCSESICCTRGRRPPRMDLLKPAQALTAAIAEYFAAATGGGMLVDRT